MFSLISLTQDERPNIFKILKSVRVPSRQFLRNLKRHHLLVLAFCMIPFFIWPLLHKYSLIKYKFRNYLYDNGFLPCSLRKDPILYMIDTHKVMLVWETNCVLKDVRIHWYEKSILDETKKIS